MTDYYHFFGIKDKEDRFLMRLVNPFGFDVVQGQVKLSELFSTHGSCPASNDVTWSPWKAGKTLYQLWNVTPNKAGLIRSATPSILLDGVTYLGSHIYLLSLADYIKLYANQLSFPDYYYDLATQAISGVVQDFLPVNLGLLDVWNMTDIFYNFLVSTLSWADAKAFAEDGYVWVDARPQNFTTGAWSLGIDSINAGIGSSVRCVVNEPELAPIYNVPASLTKVVPNALYITSVTDPDGWTHRTLFKLRVADVDYDHIIELVHTASGGRIIIVGGYTSYRSVLAGWWWPLLLFQYPLMKRAGVSAYYTE